ncbi:MAG: phosphoribosylglycinamide formyltransferase 1 [Baekduia sp.]|nr:phosphoribosylglycinamide formyltransferase 1 [Baekduia sp.]
MSLRVAVLVSGEGSNLQAILDHANGRDGVEVVAVGSNRAGARGLDRARAAGVETGVFEAGAYASRPERDEALADWLDGHGVELLVLAGFMELLAPPFIRRFAGRIINVHPSLLPAFPGIGAVQQALDYGVKLFGVTVHFVDEGVDTGAIILQRAIDLPAATDAAAVLDALRPLEHALLPDAVRLIAAGSVHRDPAHPRRVVVDR